MKFLSRFDKDTVHEKKKKKSFTYNSFTKDNKNLFKPELFIDIVNGTKKLYFVLLAISFLNF